MQDKTVNSKNTLSNTKTEESIEIAILQDFYGKIPRIISFCTGTCLKYL